MKRGRKCKNGYIETNINTGCAFDGQCDICGYPDCYATPKQCADFNQRDHGKADFTGVAAERIRAGMLRKKEGPLTA